MLPTSAGVEPATSWPVKFEKDWPKTVGGVAGRRMVGELTDELPDRQTNGHSKFQRV